LHWTKRKRKNSHGCKSVSETVSGFCVPCQKCLKTRDMTKVALIFIFHFKE
jgi:hypothetical protein